MGKKREDIKREEKGREGRKGEDIKREEKGGKGKKFYM
jgi:hypothetical protein